MLSGPAHYLRHRVGQIISRGPGGVSQEIRLSESLFLTDFYVRTLRAIVICSSVADMLGGPTLLSRP